MKHKKNHYITREDFYDEDEHKDMRKNQRRRPIRNWTKTFIENQNDVDDIDEFYSR